MRKMGSDAIRQPHIERIQAEVQEIADVLLRRRPPSTQPWEAWEEALSLRRARYETEVLKDEEDA